MLAPLYCTDRMDKLLHRKEENRYMVDCEQNKRLRAFVPVWLRENERSWNWLARKAGVSRSLLSQWKREDCNIGKERLDRIERLLER